MKVETDRITHVNAAQLLHLGEAAIAAGDSSFDLSAVTRCDSSAVALVLGWQRSARAHGAKLQLQSVPASLSSLATLYGVEALIEPVG